MGFLAPAPGVPEGAEKAGRRHRLSVVQTTLLENRPRSSERNVNPREPYCCYDMGIRSDAASAEYEQQEPECA